jgi:anti-sigma regulatory factor (Ser/Thr protein kinase)
MVVPFEVTVPGTPFGVRTLRREISGIAEDCGMDATGVADVQLAVTEAATNAVMHAYATTPGDVTVTAAVHEGELAIVIADTGGGLVERSDSPGLGVGLSIIATVADEMRITSNAGGTQIHMTFPCTDGD